VSKEAKIRACLGRFLFTLVGQLSAFMHILTLCAAGQANHESPRDKEEPEATERRCFLKILSVFLTAGRLFVGCPSPACTLWLQHPTGQPQFSQVLPPVFELTHDRSDDIVQDYIIFCFLAMDKI